MEQILPHLGPLNCCKSEGVMDYKLCKIPSINSSIGIYADVYIRSLEVVSLRVLGVRGRGDRLLELVDNALRCNFT